MVQIQADKRKRKRAKRGRPVKKKGWLLYSEESAGQRPVIGEEEK